MLAANATVLRGTRMLSLRCGLAQPRPMNHGALSSRARQRRECRGPVPAALVLAILVVAAGCKTWTPSPYIAPRVEGRVVDAETRQPLAKVKVRRVQDRDRYDTGEPRKGGQALERDRAVLTDRDGRFVVDSEQDLLLLRQATWFSVTLSFQRDGYDRFLATYSPANVSTNSPGREPVIQAGDILLHRASP